MQMQRLLILCFLFTTCACEGVADHIFINCGGPAAASTSLSGREWGGDAATEGASTASTVRGQLTAAVDPVPYSTARISRSQFSYSFHLTPGQKFIRLHFNPLSYHAFQSFHDLFTVEAGPFTLLANFSASITARALSLNILVKEFCIIVQENQPLNIVFSPETRFNCAFINGIEIISVPSTISYCHGGDTGVHVLGQKSVIYVDHTNALERVYHQNMKWGGVSFGHDMFGIWASILEGDANKASHLRWRVSVDVGFRYLVRVHLFEVGLKMDFMLMIDNVVALTSADMLQQSENQSVLWYNYMVMVKGKKREAKHRISISLHSQHELVDRQGPLEGFEVFKLSNHDLSLATPNPLPPLGESPPYSLPTLLYSLLGRKNAIATVVFANIFLVNIIVHLLHKIWGTADSSEDEKEPSSRAKRPCRRFSLAEILSATDNFHYRNYIGKGGFGKVHKGLIDNGREIVAVKRLKRGSNQGEKQFWTEVEMLSELRHVNLVPLLGFCMEKQEMILVYEYMPCGSLADHLFKLAQKSHDYIPLSWKQRLKICIGAGRALDYLHTGHGIIHRDMKSSNILLDEKFVAKVSDFGLAKTGFDSKYQSQHSTQVRGTRGYLDPDYCKTHKPTKNSDTYSFGVVLLEVLCGRRALEQHNEEDKCRLTTWALDNINEGKVDHIVLPSLIGEISTDSLKTFVKVARRCLHDEPKKRPEIAHVVVKLQLALQQQEKAESLDTNDRTNVDNLLSTDKYQQENMISVVPNGNINIVDALPQIENVTSSAPNEIRNVTNAMPQYDNDRTILSSSSKPMASSSNVQTVTFLPSQQINSTMVDSGRQGGRKSMMLRISRKLWPWDAFWKTRKLSNKMDLVGTSISAPISHRTSNITMDGNTITNKTIDRMVLTPAVESLNEKEQHCRTVRFMDNTSKEQVDDIVAPTLRGEISPDSLAERWMHDEPKNRPTTMHIVTKDEPALQQQEMAESLTPKDRTSVNIVSSSTGTSQKAVVNFSVRNEKVNVSDDASPSTVQVFPQPNIRIFTFAELRFATRNFRPDTLLGEGGFGPVYKGWLSEKSTSKAEHRTPIAVKKLSPESTQGLKEWQSEVDFLGSLSHPNLVKLIGYCLENTELLIAYEFMAKGSLENHLFRRGIVPLPWNIRVKILIGAARGLAFLHASKDTVIYRDFKTSNILLDESYQAKLSDFGLAKTGPTDGYSHVSTQVMGTYGYAAPEYVATGHLYVKSDVYGFGVVLLEMLTGMRALDTSRPSGQQNLVEWMRPYLSNRRKLKQMVDIRLEGRLPSKSALEIAQLASNCLQSEPKKRPSAQEIVHTLERIDRANHRPT